MSARDWKPARGWAAIIGAVAVALVLGSTAAPTSAATAPPDGTHRKTTESDAVAHATSPALVSMRPTATAPGQRQVPNRAVPPPRTQNRAVAPGALQGPYRGRTPAAQAPAASRNFAGLGEGFVGPQGSFEVSGYPPDPNGDVGPNHYVQMVNYSLAVFDKAGTVLHGPVLMKTLWSSLGGLCATDNNTDPIVLYDQLADRWVMSQLAYQFGGPDFQCVAVSTTADPLGTYALYAYSYEQMNDYPKMAVWPDGYYMTYVMYDSTTGGYIGGKTCALDRSKMLENLPATQQCADYEGFSYLPSDLDGPTPPPAGSPNYILGGSWTTPDQLDLYRFHVDWATPALSELAGPFAIPVAAFNYPCPSFDYGPCVPQAGTAERLDALGFRTMYRLAYRNYGTHESLATNMSVAATDDPEGQIAPRWYEIRSPGAASPVVYQQGTYAPDTTYRWMGSVAMDRDQNMALGYSRSSAMMSPDIAYTGRLATDPLGTLQAESVVPLPSTGSQDATRWGDYTAMQVDPVDDCTFWYTNQYLASDGLFNWRTRIVSFKFPSCLVPQKITFTPPGPTPLTAKTVALSATASSGLPVSFTSVTTDICTVSAATATLVRAGTCSIRASQDGNQTYSAAASVVQSFAVTKQPQSQRPGSIPRTLRNPGNTVVNPAGARTVQGRPLTATVAAQLLRGDLVCLRVINGTHRKVSVAVTGRCVVKVRVAYTATGNAAFYPYRNVVSYRLKKTRR